MCECRGLRWDRGGRTGFRAYRDGCSRADRDPVGRYMQPTRASRLARPKRKQTSRAASVNRHPAARCEAERGGSPPGCLPWSLLGELRHAEKIRQPPHALYPSTTFHRLVVQQNSAVALTTRFRHQHFLNVVFLLRKTLKQI